MTHNTDTFDGVLDLKTFLSWQHHFCPDVLPTVFIAAGYLLTVSSIWAFIAYSIKGVLE